MKYNNFKAIIASRKRIFEMQSQAESFGIANRRERAYIEPTFTKTLFEEERPRIILVSAAGATGKSALAEVLSSELRLPLLDLGKHKAVGDNSLTGLLTGAFSIDQLSSVFSAISIGEYGIIVDGIDEGRSKTTEQAFRAFLDDIAKLCRGSAVAPSFLLLGRTQVLEECWCYFEDKGLSTGLVTINPFDLEQARCYIDKFTQGPSSAQVAHYQLARDSILSKLSAAFRAAGVDGPAENFISFIGYPPVLDAVVTLLEKEQNYYRLAGQMSGEEADELEIGLLHRICTYIMDRERQEKVIPNIVKPLVQAFPEVASVEGAIFDAQEQCLRLVAHCIGKAPPPTSIKPAAARARYEEQLKPFLAEHPLISGQNFRNAIFEAVAVATLVASDRLESHEIAVAYLRSRRPSHYLVYFLALIVGDRDVPLSCIGSLLNSALEFKAPGASVELGVTADESQMANDRVPIDVGIDLAIGQDQCHTKRFSFCSHVLTTDELHVGARLASADIAVPCGVVLGVGASEIELTAPIEVRARVLHLMSQTLVLRAASKLPEAEKYVVLEAERLRSDVYELSNSAGLQFSLSLGDVAGVQYPLAQYTKRKDTLPKDPLLLDKYLRLRKILTHFRSHSKGALAKYRHKVENPRVAGNAIGSAVLQRLVSDGVLYLDDPLYFLDPERVDKYLGISWPELRRGETNAKLLDYLASIQVQT